MTLVPIRRHIERAARRDVNQGRHRQSDEHGNIRAAERPGHGTLEVLGAEERNHGYESDAIGPQAAPVPSSIHAARIEYLAHGVVPLAYQVEIHEVDRRPRREEVQENGEELAEFLHEVLR